ELDLSCTFISKARQKAGVKLPVPSKEPVSGMGSREPDTRVPGKVPNPKPLVASAVEQSLVLAGRGNEAAQHGRYAEAIKAFTQAVGLNPGEHRLFGNRSLCYERLQRYEEALQDALESLRLQPGWPKGLFRKGKALRGLKRYTEASDTFAELLQLDGADEEASAQFAACQALQRVSPCSQCTQLPPHKPSPYSLPVAEQPRGSCQDGDSSGFITVRSSKSQRRGQQQPASTGPPVLPPTHPARDCFPLWVGNVTPRISKEVLEDTFSPFGEIRSIRRLPGRRCAFVNFTHKKAAEAAFKTMQDAELEGTHLALQLKHPSHATPAPQRHP
ncbi:TTC31 protein, partial [Rhinopomastus cyanomelas]|nr:TTC31 protein [Rhinopomastus cyanomelas]